jgi:maltooligosyltrehalose synthase
MLTTAGRCQDHICTFARAAGDCRIITVVPRLLAQLLPEVVLRPQLMDWEDTTVVLPREFTRSNYRNVLTGELSMILGGFPLAVLSSVGEGVGD